MELERTQLMEDLTGFVLAGSGVLVGKPGVGKTYSLVQLQERLQERGIPSLFLPIDQLGTGSDEELRAELAFEGDIITQLERVIEGLSSRPAVLLMDAFDAARDEIARRRFLRLIQRAIEDLHGEWHIIVSVRIYDAQKSPELLSLFGKSFNSDSSQYRSSDIPCRHFLVPPLNPDEVRFACAQTPGMEAIYDASASDFRNLLATPFNLWLLEQLPADLLPRLTQISSQVQLLKLYWNSRVRARPDKEDREYLLAAITRKMVIERSLSIRKDDIYSPNLKNLWAELLSDGILTEIGPSRQRLAYAHNILFDYATSTLLIEDDPEKLVEFIIEDQARPLFLSPSFTYHFTDLWYSDKEAFWRSFWYVLPKDHAYLRLFARVLPTGVIAHESRSVDDLAPILDSLAGGDALGIDATLRLIQAHQSFKITRDSLWIEFFVEVSRHISRQFAWEMSLITSEILDRAVAAFDESIVDSCGHVGRNLLGWIWDQREGPNDPWLDALCARWVIPLVARTFKTNVEQSRALLQPVIGITQEQSFPIDFFFHLIHRLDCIWPYDPHFVGETFVAVFGYEETSNSPTQMGTPVVGLTSTRRQDFGGCQFQLIQLFPAFLEAAPKEAFEAGVRSLDAFIVQKHIKRYVHDDDTLERATRLFRFRGGTARYLADGSQIWGGDMYLDEPLVIADHAFGYLDEMASDRGRYRVLGEWLSIMRDEARVAFLWKRLLETASRQPSGLLPYLFDLCVARPVQTGSDTRRELAKFLAIAAPLYSRTRLRLIERSILGLTRDTSDGNELAYLEQCQAILLSHIPFDLLESNRAKSIHMTTHTERSYLLNDPVTIRSFSDADWEVAEPQSEELPDRHAKLKSLVSAISRLTTNATRNALTLDAIRMTLPSARALFDALSDMDDWANPVTSEAWSQLGLFAELIASKVSSMSENEFAFVRSVLLACAVHPRPNTQYADDSSYATAIWTLEPRNQAALGLPLLANHELDREILDAVVALTNDSVPSVRFLVARQLFHLAESDFPAFWEICETVAVRESNRVVREGLCYSLSRVASKHVERTAQILSILVEHMHLSERDDSPESLAPLVLWLAFSRQSAVAGGIAESFFAEPTRFPKLMLQATVSAMGYITPAVIASTDEDQIEVGKRAISWVECAITKAAEGIKAIRAIHALDPHDIWMEALRDIYSVIDRVVMQLMFATGGNSIVAAREREPASDDQKRVFYFEVKSLIELILTFAEDRDQGFIIASTSHNLLQFLNSVLSYEPRSVLRFARRLVVASEPANYNLDVLAISEVVKFVEAILADHRVAVREGESLSDLLDLLDVFARVGWPDALRLVWRLDEVFR